PRPGGRPDGERAGRAARPEGARRPARPARPPALDDEQTATLTAAYQAVVGESGLEPAADKVIERIAAHDGFERASMAGWEVAAGGHAEERTAQEWELLRAAWLSVRLALLEAYATFKPDAADALARERKQQARLAKPPRPRRRPGRGPDRGRGGTPRPGSSPRPPSPADVARHAGAHGAGTAEPAGAVPADAALAPTDGDPVPVEVVPAPTDREPAAVAGDAVQTGVEPSPEVNPVIAETPPQGLTALDTEGADPETDVALPDSPAADHEQTTPDERPEPDAVEAAAPEHDIGTVDAEPGAAGESSTPEHEAYAAPSPEGPSSEGPSSEGEGPSPVDVDEGQMALDL
ncbi:MAG TPA: hypothetical protein VF288_11875, partial [Mycobacteriales bacterium]